MAALNATDSNNSASKKYLSDYEPSRKVCLKQNAGKSRVKREAEIIN